MTAGLGLHYRKNKETGGERERKRNNGKEKVEGQKRERERERESKIQRRRDMYRLCRAQLRSKKNIYTKTNLR